MNNSKESKVSLFNKILMAILICIGVLVFYDFVYYLTSILVYYTMGQVSDSKLDALATFGILVASLLVIYIVQHRQKLKKENERRFEKILTFKKLRLKNYLIATIFVIAMMAISNMWLYAYETVTGDTKTMAEVSQSLVSDLDKFNEDEVLEEATEDEEVEEGSSDKTSSQEEHSKTDEDALSDEEYSESDEGASSDEALSEDEASDQSDNYLITYLWVFASVVLFGAITEEVIMRGLCFKLLKGYSHPLVAIFLSALTFGVFHRNIPQGGYTFLMGIFLAILYFYTKDFLVVCYAHLLNNFLFTLPKMPENVEDMILSTLGILGYILTPLAIYLAIKIYRKALKEELENKKNIVFSPSIDLSDDNLQNLDKNFDSKQNHKNDIG